MESLNWYTGENLHTVNTSSTTYLPCVVNAVCERPIILLLPQSTLLNYRAAHSQKLGYYTIIFFRICHYSNALSFYRSQKFFGRPKSFMPVRNLIAFSATPKKIVSALKLNLLNAKILGPAHLHNQWCFNINLILPVWSHW